MTEVGVGRIIGGGPGVPGGGGGGIVLIMINKGLLPSCFLYFVSYDNDNGNAWAHNQS